MMGSPTTVRKVHETFQQQQDNSMMPWDNWCGEVWNIRLQTTLVAQQAINTGWSPLLCLNHHWVTNNESWVLLHDCIHCWISAMESNINANLNSASFEWSLQWFQCCKQTEVMCHITGISSLMVWQLWERFLSFCWTHCHDSHWNSKWMQNHKSSSTIWAMWHTDNPDSFKKVEVAFSDCLHICVKSSHKAQSWKLIA